jgi:putative redox protein
MKAKLMQLDGLTLMGRSDTGHWVPMDAPVDIGGHGAGPRPMELMLIGIAGCAAMDIIAILKKKKVDLRGFEVNVEADRSEEHPQLFKKITFNYTVSGKNIQTKDVERAIELTDSKYCGAIENVRGSAEIVHNFTIREVD